MATLMALRARIKTVSSIKKITHAMRLIAMSSHSKIRDKRLPARAYTHEINRLYSSIQQQVPPTTIEPPKNSKKINILIGSQKGLCGGFNTQLAHFFERYYSQQTSKDTEYIALGAWAVEYARLHNISLMGSYTGITSDKISFYAQALAKLIQQYTLQYKLDVVIYSMQAKSFFVRVPQRTILALTPEITQNTHQEQQECIIENPQLLLTTLAELSLISSLEHILLESLLAEQAARFISMDGATRNAQKLIDEMKLDYHKLRQTQITKELTELASSF